jgi:Tfp pilus assembly protein PilX
MSTTPSTPTERQQAGMVAIMVTLILMIVITLIVLGFAQISRRNQRQALDRQLSTQAFYAAETGVNDAAKLIKDAVAASNPVADKPDCASNGGGFYSGLSSVISAANSVEYTCMLVDPSPPSLVYSSVGSTSTIVPVIAEGGGPINTVTLTWQSTEGSATPAATCPAASGNVFTVSGLWTCGYGVLRFDLVPSAVAYNLSTLQTATMSVHVVPLRPGGAGATVQPVNYATGGANNRVFVVCSNINCTLTLNFPAPQSQYHMRVSSLYKEVSLRVTATSGGSPVSLSGAQALVDVTGKAEDVLRRIQVRLPLAGSSSNQLSDYALGITRPICKRFSVMDGHYESDANTAVPGVYDVSPNRLCE